MFQLNFILSETKDRIFKKNKEHLGIKEKDAHLTISSKIKN
jgi:hypothetical protein